jgi:small redox-active disulfide protein 2
VRRNFILPSSRWCRWRRTCTGSRCDSRQFLLHANPIRQVLLLNLFTTRKESIMKNIKVLGTGCANCKTTLKLIEEAAESKGLEVQLEKVEDIADIMSYGVMSTPGVVIDGKVVHAGGVPDRKKIDGWLA